VARKSLSPCAEPGCPTLVREAKCDLHRREASRQDDARRPSSVERGYDATWRATRAAYLKAYPQCQDPQGCIKPATDVDHIDGQGPRGPRGHDWANLRGLCHSHHSQRTARDQPGGWSKGKRATSPFIVIAGGPGVGKTAVRDILASRLHAVALGPDDTTWPGLYDILDRSEQAIVECVRMPHALLRKMEQRGATVIELYAPIEVRRERLLGRGETRHWVERVLKERAPLAYGQDVPVDIEVEALPPAEVIAEGLYRRLTTELHSTPSR